MERTIGEIRVRTDFNPSNQSRVDRIKQLSATLINLCEEDAGRLILEADNGNDKAKLAAFFQARKAQDQFEDAAMWAVKAATG